MIIKIPIVGWFSTKTMKCNKCHKDVGHIAFHVININDDMVFHSDCETDYVAEKEGWTEYRERYKAIQKKFKTDIVQNHPILQ